jgi:DNA modification methylase
VNLTAEVIVGDNRETLRQLPDKSVQTVVTSPPYWGLRDYGEDEQIGLEESPQDFVEQLCLVFDEVWRVLKDDGTIWVNLGDSYAGSGKGSPGNFGKHAPSGSARHLEHKHSGIVPDGLKPKDLVGIPWRFAFAMQDRDWYLRQDIIWAKPNPMPESVTDRCTKSHEYIFLMTKNPKYYYDQEAIREPVAESSIGRLNQDITNQVGTTRANGGMKTNGNLKAVGDVELGRNKRSVWQVTTSRYKDAHFATYPPELITPCILAGSKEGDIVLDPFSGSGTTGEVSLLHNRNYIGLELNPEYAKLSEKRLLEAGGMFASVSVR